MDVRREISSSPSSSAQSTLVLEDRKQSCHVEIDCQKTKLSLPVQQGRLTLVGRWQWIMFGGHLITVSIDDHIALTHPPSFFRALVRIDNIANTLLADMGPSSWRKLRGRHSLLLHYSLLDVFRRPIIRIAFFFIHRLWEHSRTIKPSIY